ncbi:MAG: HhH-GPD-type base excision DNA repair protein [Microbacteriaceae bacterium]
MTIYLTGEAAADALLTDDDLALLLGMLLDQQVTMESAFAGPAKIRDRIGTLDVRAIAEYEPEAFVTVFKQPPAVHRFPGSMAARVQAVCVVLRDTWHGEASAVWSEGDPDGAEILRRLKTLPGFGEQKARIFLALLGKQRGLAAPGWREASAPYGEAGTTISVADIVDAESLARVRESKKAAKAAAKAAKAG